MSETAFYAHMIKNQLEDLEQNLEPENAARGRIAYILKRLWPDLESAMKHDLPS
jgi:hypothetical protein